MNRLQLGVAGVSVLLMTPFAINNFVHGRYSLGVGAALIVIVFIINSWSILRSGRHYPMLLLLGLVPAILFFLTLSIRDQGLVGVFWCYPAVISVYFLLPERKAWIANVAIFAVALPSIILQIEAGLVARIIITLVMVSALSGMFIRAIERLRRQLELQAATDPLTGVANRSRLAEQLGHAAAQHARTDVPMTLVGFDLDQFKQVNDQKGHAAGDEVLRCFARILKQRRREVDALFRTGGEEFLMLLYGTGQAGALVLAEEIRRQVESACWVEDTAVTVSVGVAELRRKESWEDWVKRCDQNLYRAKRQGRNQVVADSGDGVHPAQAQTA